MRTTLVRVEQDEANPAEVDKIVNAAIKRIEDAGERVLDVRAVGLGVVDRYGICADRQLNYYVGRARGVRGSPEALKWMAIRCPTRSWKATKGR